MSIDILNNASGSAMMPKDRISLLDAFVSLLAKAQRNENVLKINFICTHNSRRSQLAELLVFVIAKEMGLTNIECYSGGTEATSFNYRMVRALGKKGYALQAVDQGDNPRYKLRSENSDKLFFSKVFDDAANPKANFIAVTVCSDAESNCPYIPGAKYRFHLPYLDPKAYDDSPQESQKYQEKISEIETEMRYVLSKLRDTQDQ